MWNVQVLSNLRRSSSFIDIDCLLRLRVPSVNSSCESLGRLRYRYGCLLGRPPLVTEFVKNSRDPRSRDGAWPRALAWLAKKTRVFATYAARHLYANAYGYHKDCHRSIPSVFLEDILHFVSVTSPQNININVQL